MCRIIDNARLHTIRFSVPLPTVGRGQGLGSAAITQSQKLISARAFLVVVSCKKWISGFFCSVEKASLYIDFVYASMKFNDFFPRHFTCQQLENKRHVHV